jgi:hypothetical protein
MSYIILSDAHSADRNIERQFKHQFKSMKKQNKDLTPLLSVIPQDIFVIAKGGYVLLGVNPITKEEVVSLQEEIKFLEKTRIWSIMTASICDKAKEKMFENALTFEDMTFGKAMLKNVQLMKQIMSQIKGIKIPVEKAKKHVTDSKPVV